MRRNVPDGNTLTIGVESGGVDHSESSDGGTSLSVQVLESIQ
nr:hypothetical protein [uncultured Chryseobacterium sp.]